MDQTGVADVRKDGAAGGRSRPAHEAAPQGPDGGADRRRPAREAAPVPFSRCTKGTDALRNAWGHVRDLAPDVVDVVDEWTTGARRRPGRKGQGDSQGLPQEPVRRKILNALLRGPAFKDMLSKFVGKPGSVVLTPVQVAVLNETLGREAQRIVRALDWAARLRALYENNGEIRRTSDRYFVNADNRFLRVNLTNTILEAVWGKAEEGGLVDLREASPEDQTTFLDRILVERTEAPQRANTAACRRILAEPGIRQRVEGEIDRLWEPAPTTRPATDAGLDDLTMKVAGARMMAENDDETLCQAIRCEHTPVDELLQAVVRQCGKDGSDVWELVRRSKPLRLTRDVERSSLRRRPAPQWDRLLRRSGRDRAADESEPRVKGPLREPPLDLGYVPRVLHVFNNTVSEDFPQDRLPEVLVDEARRCAHCTGLAWVQSRLVITMAALVVEFVLQETERVLSPRPDKDDVGQLLQWHPRSLVHRAVREQVLKERTAVQIAFRPARSASASMRQDGSVSWAAGERQLKDDKVKAFISRVASHAACSLWYQWHRYEFLGLEDKRDGFSVKTVQERIYFAVKQACIDAGKVLVPRPRSSLRQGPQGGGSSHPALPFIMKIQELRIDEPYASVYSLMRQYRNPEDGDDGPGTIPGRSRELRDDVPREALRLAERDAVDVKRGRVALELMGELDHLYDDPQVGPLLDGVDITDILDCLNRM